MISPTQQTMTFSLTRNIFDFAVVLTGLLFQYFVAQIEWQFMVIACIGSIFGAITLGYFRREKNNIETVLKILISVMTGLVIGAAIEEYYKISNIKYQLINYFLAGLLSLAFLRALVRLTEKNAASIIQTAIARLLGIKTKEEKEKIREEK